MSDPNMASYVTRGELREELKRFGEQLEQKLEQKFNEKLAPYAKKTDLDAVCTALIARMERGEQALRHSMNELGQQMQRNMNELEQRLTAELRRHAGATKDDLDRNVRGIDDKYADLPRRVEKLEAAVFSPKRQRRR